jgi:hypothetical protein
MLKKIALFFLFLILVALVYFNLNNQISNSEVTDLPKTADLSPTPISTVNLKTPEAIMIEARLQKKQEEDWANAQVDWLTKQGMNEEDAHALARWQDQLLDALDEDPDQKIAIEKEYQKKLEKILGPKRAHEYLKFKSEYDEKIK